MRTWVWLFVPAALLAQVNVPYERIRDANKEPGNWLTYSRDYSGQRYSPLDQINTGNVGKLHIAWMRQVDETDTFETSPIAVDGTLFVTEPPNVVEALDAATGRPLWRYRKELPNDLRLCCGKVNRGLAILGNTLYYASTDAHLIALDARTGDLRWDVTMADYKNGYSGTGAPLAVKDKIITGMAGGEFGVRGFIDGYDAKTGKRLWRFNTIPAKGEPGNETWDGESWKTGSATAWVTGAYDPETQYGLLGHRKSRAGLERRRAQGRQPVLGLPDRAGSRHGREEVALPIHAARHERLGFDADADSGRMATVAGQVRKMVVLANRNGFYYALDRVTGKFIAGRPYVKQTWASGLDEAGRPMRVPDAEPTVEGKLIWPSLGGGSNWYSSTYNPKTDLYYVNVKEEAGIYHKGEAEYRAGALFNGGGQTQLQGRGAVRRGARAGSGDGPVALGVQAALGRPTRA